jgi:hypothetical protein
MKTYGGVDVQTHVFLTSALTGGEWSASRPGRFTPEERAPHTHWIGGCVGPRHGKVKILAPAGTRTPTHLVVQPVVSRYIDCVIPAHFYFADCCQIWQIRVGIR